VDAYLTKGHFQGYILLVRHGRTLLSKAYGLADVEHHLRHTIHTRWPIFSIESFMVAMAVLKLQEEGRLHVQDRLCRYLATCPQGWESLTLYNLLTSTSEIADDDAPYFQSGTPKDALLGCETSPLSAGAPGTVNGEDFSCNFLLLSVVVARAAGQPFGATMQRLVFGPAGLTETNVVDRIPPGSARGYSSGIPTPQLYADGYPIVYSSPADLLRLDQAFLAGKILSRKLQSVLATPRVGAPDWPGFAGFGTGVTKANRLPMGGTATGVAPFRTNRTLGQGSGGPDPSGYGLNNGLSPDDGSVLIDLNNDTGSYTHDDDNAFLDHLARLMWGR
jgi:CubicO group peptidase (beta-lactamase class C family)